MIEGIRGIKKKYSYSETPYYSGCKLGPMQEIVYEAFKKTKGLVTSYQIAEMIAVEHDINVFPFSMSNYVQKINRNKGKEVIKAIKAKGYLYIADNDKD